VGGGTLRDCRYLLHDRDTKYTQSFRAIIVSARVEPLVLPARSPNLNAYAERWVRSVKEECLSKVILFGSAPCIRRRSWSARSAEAEYKRELLTRLWKLVQTATEAPEDARDAVRSGADGIVVSNHGGRQLDGAIPTARALPHVVDAVGDDLTVLADGGIRSGLDVVPKH
jgi:transposase InsO family protein